MMRAKALMIVRQILMLVVLCFQIFVVADASAQLVELEPNNSTAQANIAPVGALITGQFSIKFPSTGFDNDYFVFQNLSPGRLSLELSLGGVSCCDYVYFEVFDDSGNILSGDYVQEGGSATWDVAITGGDYYLRLYGDTDDSYLFAVTNLASTNGLEIEPNEQSANLIALSEDRFGQFYRKFPNTGYDLDWFYLPVSGPSFIDLEVAAFGTSCCDYVYFEVVDEDANVLSGGIVPEGNTAIWPVNLRKAGNYFVKLYGDTRNYYRVRLLNSGFPAAYEVEPNGGFSNATPISPNEIVFGQFYKRFPSTGFDVDFFYFDTISSGVLTLDANLGGSSCCDDVYIEVRDSQNNILFADSVGEGDSGQWSVGIGAAAKYYVRVYGDTDELYGLQISGAIFSTAPGKPTITGFVAGDSQISITSVSVDDGGSPITDYRAECSGVTARSAALPLTVTGLTNGTEYACDVLVSTAFGSSERSATVSITPRGAPSSVTITSVEPEDDALTVTVSANTDGGQNVVYQVQCGDQVRTSDTSPVTVDGLSNGVPYTCSARVTNEFGTSDSQSSVTGTPEFISTGLPIWLIYEATK